MLLEISLDRQHDSTVPVIRIIITRYSPQICAYKFFPFSFLDSNDFVTYSLDVREKQVTI